LKKPILFFRRKSVGAVAPFGSEPAATASSSLAQNDLPPAASSTQPTDLVAAATTSPVVAIRLPIKCGKGRAAAGGQSFGGSDTDSDTQSTKSTGSAHRVAARTFKKSFKGKAVAIVKPFSSVSGEKKSPGGPVKEQKSGSSSSKSDLLNLLYDFKSDEESSASVERQRESSQLLSGSDVSGVTGTVTTAAKNPNCDESDSDTVVELVTPPPLTGVSASALVCAEISSAATAATAKQIRGGNTGVGAAKPPSVVARRLKFGGAPPELKAVRVRVEKLQQASAPPLYAAAAPAANQPNPTSVSGKYSAQKPEDGVGGEETIKKEPAAEACSVIGSQPASVPEIKSEPVVDSVGSSASDCSTEKEKKVGEVKVEVEPTAAIPPDIKPGQVLFNLMG
jgi:hypothetical protein